MPRPTYQLTPAEHEVAIGRGVVAVVARFVEPVREAA